MIKAVLLDLDGTLYLGDNAIKGAAEKLEELRSKGVKTLFLTNAATRSREGRAEKLRSVGLEARKEEIYCTASMAARYISDNHRGEKVFVIGEHGIDEELKEAGIETVEEGADIVIVGLDRGFTYEKLVKGMHELQKGAKLIATNKDPTFPTHEGMMPGAGSVVAAVETASGKQAFVIGKPSCYALELIQRDHGLEGNEILMIGDRLDTDITFAKNCGIKSALVLSGVSKKSDIKEIKPDYIFDSIADVSLP